MTLALIPFLGAASAALPACVPPTGERLLNLGIRAHGHSFGGLTVVEWTASGWTLVSLSPAGLPIFTAVYAEDANGAGTTAVSAPAFPEMEPYLELLPFDRDLRLLAADSEPDCAWGRARILHRSVRTLWRGSPGPARVEMREVGSFTLTDPWRGYTLTVVPVAVPVAREAGVGP